MEAVIFISLAVIATISILWRDHVRAKNAIIKNLLDRGIAHAATVRELQNRANKAEAELQRLPAPTPVFDGDKIPDKSGRVSYVPVARRRAQAEAAILGPKTHGDKLRENNIRAIESAG